MRHIPGGYQPRASGHNSTPKPPRVGTGQSEAPRAEVRRQDGQVDEVVSDHVHLERMDDDHVWICIEGRHFHLRAVRRWFRTHIEIHEV